MRGAESRHTLVLVDGMRINTATTGQPSLEIIPLRQRRGASRSCAARRASCMARKRSAGDPDLHPQGRGRRASRGSSWASTHNTCEVDASVAGGSGRLRATASAPAAPRPTASLEPDPVKQPFCYQPDRGGYRNTHFNASASLGFQARDEIGATVLRTEGTIANDAFGTVDAYLDKTVTSLGVS